MTECEKLPGRLREICEGKAGLSLGETNLHRARWGLEPLHKVTSAVLTPRPSFSAAAKPIGKKGCGSCGGARIPHGRLNGWGVGSQLTREYESRGYPHCQKCHALAVQMDLNGIEWCRTNLEKLIDDILPRAKEMVANAMAFVHWGLRIVRAEDLVLRAAIRTDIEAAIGRAEVAPRPERHHHRRGSRKRITELPPRPPVKPVTNVALITCHFNPLGWSRPRENYWRFRDGLGRLADRLTTWELSFDGRFEIPEAKHLHGSEANILWQKEAMLNSMVWQLPDDVDAVAWLDADLMWADSWLDHGVEALNGGLLAVQLFGTLTSLNASGGVERVTQSYSKAAGNGSFNCGGAWMARVETLRAMGGLYPFALSGAGDSLAIEGWLGRIDNPIRKWSVPNGAAAAYRKSIKDWQRNAFEVVQGAIGCVDIGATHLFHGKRSRRRYPAFAAALVSHAYDPNVDVRLTPAGILEWSSDKPKLHAAVRDHLLARNEDG